MYQKLKNSQNLKKYVKKNPYLIKLYRLHQSKAWWKKSFSKTIKGRNNKIKLSKSAVFINCKFNVRGEGNLISIADICFFKNVTFFIAGNNNRIHIDKDVNFFRGGEFWVEDNNCEITIGSNSTFEDVHLAATESGSKIIIGTDCMLANGIDIRTGDSHSILDKITGKRINYAKNVVLENKVWIGAHCSILKGAHIATESVVATRSVVTKEFRTSNIILAGIPAVMVKKDILWDRKRL